MVTFSAFLTGFIVSMVACYIKRMITTCLSMAGYLCATIIGG